MKVDVETILVLANLWRFATLPTRIHKCPLTCTDCWIVGRRSARQFVSCFSNQSRRFTGRSAPVRELRKLSRLGHLVHASLPANCQGFGRRFDGDHVERETGRAFGWGLKAWSAAAVARGEVVAA